MTTQPSPGDIVNVLLPHELVRAEVLDVMGRNRLLAALTVAAPLGKTHDYKLGERVWCERETQPLGGDRWAVRGRATMPDEVPPEPPKGKRRDPKKKD